MSAACRVCVAIRRAGGIVAPVWCSVGGGEIGRPKSQCTFRGGRLACNVTPAAGNGPFRRAAERSKAGVRDTAVLRCLTAAPRHASVSAARRRESSSSTPMKQAGRSPALFCAHRAADGNVVNQTMAIADGRTGARAHEGAAASGGKRRFTVVNAPSDTMEPAPERSVWLSSLRPFFLWISLHLSRIFPRVLC